MYKTQHEWEIGSIHTVLMYCIILRPKRKKSSDTGIDKDGETRRSS